ncbi:MAG: hypothetical protein M1114_04210 [Candidatus Dependentiae bacterium]|nr:hypothetical protein [Candidatus Dependentiae bacterium]
MKQKSFLFFIFIVSMNIAIPINDKVTKLEHALEKIDTQLMQKIKHIEDAYIKLDQKITGIEASTQSIEIAKQHAESVPPALSQEEVTPREPQTQVTQPTEQTGIPTPLPAPKKEPAEKQTLLEEIKQKPKLKPIETTASPKMPQPESEEEEQLRKRRKAMFGEGEEEEESIILKPAPSKEEVAPSESQTQVTQPTGQTGTPTPPLAPKQEVIEDKSKPGERVDLLEQIKTGTKLKPIKTREKIEDLSDAGLKAVLEDMYLGEMSIEQLNAELEKVDKETRKATIRRKKVLQGRKENINFVINLKKMSLEQLDKALAQEAFNTNKEQASNRTSWIEQVIKEKGGTLDDLEESDNEWED